MGVVIAACAVVPAGHQLGCALGIFDVGAELKLSDCGESGGIDLDLSAKCGVLAVGCSPSDLEG
jgi:hypothetical protein